MTDELNPIVQNELELKNILSGIVERIVNLMRLDRVSDSIKEYVERQYLDSLEKAEVKFNINFVPQQEQVDFLKNYVDQTVREQADAIRKDLSGEISRAIDDGVTTSQLKIRVKDVLKQKKYTDRLKTILRTEGLRANNKAQYDAAQQTGFKLKKYLLTIQDGVTSDICKKEGSKYGEPSQAIPMSQEFVVKVGKRTIRGMKPPFHPNCRSVLAFVRVE